MRIRTCLAALAALILLSPAALAQSAQPADVAPPAPRPDERFKLDILVVVAHPDDETMIAPYLARAVFDEGRRVGVVYATDGGGGGNQTANERAASLTAVREVEARRGLAEIGVDHVWFLGARDTPFQNVLFSLANWPHGVVLEQVVRLVRLTRPEVVMTLLPRIVAGENHGDHQAAGVVATEAFFMAGNPVVFPGQLGPPRLRLAVENLRPWYPKKLYYFSDAYDDGFLDGLGPSYDPDAVSSSRKAPYSYFATRLASHHLSQFGPRFPKQLLDAIARNDVAETTRLVRERRQRPPDPVRLALAHTTLAALQGKPATADVFEGIKSGEVVLQPVLPLPSSAIEHERLRPPALSLDGPWAFYRVFSQSYGSAEVLTVPLPIDIAVRPAHELHIPVRLRNTTADAQEVTLERTPALPPGWTETPLPKIYRLAPGEDYRIDAVFMSPPTASDTPVEFTYTARAGGRVLGTVSLKVLVRTGTMPH